MAQSFHLSSFRFESLPEPLPREGELHGFIATEAVDEPFRLGGEIVLHALLKFFVELFVRLRELVERFDFLCHSILEGGANVVALAENRGRSRDHEHD